MNQRYFDKAPFSVSLLLSLIEKKTLNVTHGRNLFFLQIFKKQAFPAIFHDQMILYLFRHNNCSSLLLVFE